MLWLDLTGTPQATRRTARATEAQAQMLYDALTPEAKARVQAARAARLAHERRGEMRVVKVVLWILGIFAALWIICAWADRAHAQALFGDPYDGARCAQRYTAPPSVTFLSPPNPLCAYGYAPLPPAAMPPIAPPVEQPPPQPLGWVYRYYAPCADPGCGTLRVAVGADGLNVRVGPAGPVTGALANGAPLVPLRKEGDWVLVAPACPLVPTWQWSWTAGVPLSVCL